MHLIEALDAPLVFIFSFRGNLRLRTRKIRKIAEVRELRSGRARLGLLARIGTLWWGKNQEVCSPKLFVGSIDLNTGPHVHIYLQAEPRQLRTQPVLRRCSTALRRGFVHLDLPEKLQIEVPVKTLFF